LHGYQHLPDDLRQTASTDIGRTAGYLASDTAAYWYTMALTFQFKLDPSLQTVAKAITKMFESDEVKGSFFLSTLPATMNTIIDNLSTRNLIAFKDIEPKILDVADRHSLDSTDSTAYTVRQAAARSNRGPRSTTPARVHMVPEAQPHLNRPCLHKLQQA
jgi:hypothetical protein